MKTLLVTGAAGFIGKNLTVAVKRQGNRRVIAVDVQDPPGALVAGLDQADAIIHLAGVNRPERVEEFEAGNLGSLQDVMNRLRESGRRPLVALSSSMQATLDNPYGVSKRRAEEALRAFGEETGTPVRIFRLPGVFGKWCRPNYNSVVATFCHNIAHDLPISISDPSREIELAYLDDVVAAFIGLLDGREPAQADGVCQAHPTYHTTLGALADTIKGFRESRQTLQLADFADPFTRKLYATYLSYLPADDFAYALQQRTDPRGVLAELLKSPHFGQIFVSRTKPGITRGNHYHDTKVEKFCVIDGDAIIRFRHILNGEVLEYPVSGRDFKVVDIPPGYTHSIQNVGEGELITLFWASELFDPSKPDTYAMPVLDLGKDQVQ